VVVRAGIVPLFRADEGQVLDARDVRRMGAMQVTAGEGVRIQFVQVARGQHAPDQVPVLGVGTVAPVHALGPAARSHLLHPAAQFRGCVCGGRQSLACSRHASLSSGSAEFTSPAAVAAETA
jgi:hypothetical protein